MPHVLCNKPAYLCDMDDIRSPLWSLPLAPSITLCIQDPLSSHYTATVDPAGK